MAQEPVYTRRCSSTVHQQGRQSGSGEYQSYVLFTLGQPELRRLLLPVGEYPKEEIRRKAVDAGLAVADKPDSQDICFIPDGDYRKFVGERVKPRPGMTDGRHRRGLPR